jgi:hypothetical protein
MLSLIAEGDNVEDDTIDSIDDLVEAGARGGLVRTLRC